MSGRDFHEPTKRLSIGPEVATTHDTRASQSPPLVPLEPKRIMQTELGPRGDCQSACLAMMLGCELSEVPKFNWLYGHDPNEYSAKIAEWLGERGLQILTFLPWQGLPWPPRGFYIAGGVSERGQRHAVIYRDGKLWHDPAGGNGIEEVTDIDLILPIGFRPALGQAATAAMAKIGAGQRRTYLGNRRVNCSDALAWNGLDILVCVGFDRDGIGREVFAEGMQCGSDLDVLVDDAVILLSMLLRHGYRLDEIFAKLMRADIGSAADRFKDEATGAAKPSLLAAIVGAAIKIELQEGDRLKASQGVPAWP